MSIPRALAALALAVVAGTGCVNQPMFQPAEPTSDAAVPSRPRPITADQVAAQNADAQAEALRQELALSR